MQRSKGRREKKAEGKRGIIRLKDLLKLICAIALYQKSNSEPLNPEPLNGYFFLLPLRYSRRRFRWIGESSSGGTNHLLLEDNMISKGFFFLLLSLILVSAVSCEKSLEPSDSVDTETSLEDRLEVCYDETQTADEVASFRNTPYCSIFERLLEDKGYHIWSDDAAHYKATDPTTGQESWYQECA